LPSLPRRRVVLAVAAALVAPGVQAQAAGEEQAAALAKTAADLNARLADVNAKLSVSQAALSQLEAQGPRTLEVQERLAVLQRDGPAQLAAFRERLQKLVQDNGAKIRTEREQSLAQLKREQDEDSARFQREDTNQRRQLKALLEQGPATQAMERELADVQGALERERTRRDTVMAELRAGYFCSECSRSKSEIEAQEGTTFEAHLRQVKGHAVMRPEKLKERQDQLDAQVDALARRESALDTRIEQTQRKFQTDVDTARKELTERELAYEARTTRNAAQRQRVESEAARKQAELASEAKSVEAGIQAKELEYTQTVERLQKEAAARAQSFAQKKAQLDASVRTLSAEKTRLASAASAAYQSYVSAQRAAQEAVQRAAAEREMAEAQERRVVRDRWLDDTKAAVQARLRQAHARVDRGAERDAAAVAALAQQQQRAQSSQRDYAQRFGSEQVEAEPTSVRALAATLTARAEAAFDNLPQPVKERIQEAAEALGTPRNAARAVVDHAIDAVESSVRDSLLARLKGEPRSLAQDLAAAAEAAEPDVGATVKSKLMPIVDEAAVELVVAGRSVQEGRRFDGQELTVERGFARTRLFGANLSKHFDGLLKTLDETMGNATRMMGDW
jgi:DNA repair exonuclease SbcCD ATPase subunit